VVQILNVFQETKTNLPNPPSQRQETNAKCKEHIHVRQNAGQTCKAEHCPDYVMLGFHVIVFGMENISDNQPAREKQTDEKRADAHSVASVKSK
jgi:hypothetical protein